MGGPDLEHPHPEGFGNFVIMIPCQAEALDAGGSHSGPAPALRYAPPNS